MSKNIKKVLIVEDVFEVKVLKLLDSMGKERAKVYAPSFQIKKEKSSKVLVSSN
jgi:hypothetical protein